MASSALGHGARRDPAGAGPSETPCSPARARGGDNAELRVKAITKIYRGREVVKDVSFHLARGEVTALMGPNGAGRTTCFYMMTGLIPADRGTIWFEGRDITQLPMHLRARLGLGYLPQETSVFRGLNVEQNIRAIAEMRVGGGRASRDVTDVLIAELDLGALRKVSAGTLSGGELRRVEIARVLASDPRYILLDEPFAGVDPLGVEGMRTAILYLRRRGLGVLITDHSVHETLEIVDRALVLYAGELLFEGSPEAVIRDPAVRRLYLGQGFR